MLEYFAALGTRAISITGGGEPTAHPRLREICEACRRLDIEINLITNGLAWGRSCPEWANDLLSLISVSTVDPAGEPRADRVANICAALPNVCIRVKFMVPRNVNVDAAVATCKMSRGHANLKHVLFLRDILDPADAALAKVRRVCERTTSKVGFMPRAKSARGMNPCLISRLRPYVDASGWVYPCCGASFAFVDEERCMPDRMQMCRWTEFAEMAPFDGGACERCLYEHHNMALRDVTTARTHERFV